MKLQERRGMGTTKVVMILLILVAALLLAGLVFGWVEAAKSAILGLI